MISGFDCNRVTEISGKIPALFFSLSMGLFLWTLAQHALASGIVLEKSERPQLILLKSYHKGMDVKNWSMSEKLDGVRAYWNGQTLYSRSGRKIAAPKWFTKDFPNFKLDGELWTKRGDFEHITSIVNRHKPHNGWKQITYEIFEVPDAPGSFPERLNRIKSWQQQQPSQYIHIVDQSVCKGPSHLQSFLSEVEQKGGEGVVIRNPDLPYHTGRSQTSLKVKSFQDAECQVTGYKKGRGKFIRMTGALYCQIQDQRVISIGSGLSNEERANPPPIGSIVTYKHNGYTSTGKPRFPVYLRIRIKNETHDDHATKKK